MKGILEEEANIDCFLYSTPARLLFIGDTSFWRQKHLFNSK